MYIGRRKPGEPDLVSPTGAAAIIGVSQTNVRYMKGIPEPYMDKRDHIGTTLWRRSDIEQFRDSRTPRRKDQP